MARASNDSVSGDDRSLSVELVMARIGPTISAPSTPAQPETIREPRMSDLRWADSSRPHRSMSKVPRPSIAIVAISVIAPTAPAASPTTSTA